MSLSICFCVPKGLEDIAREEIEEKLLAHPTLSKFQVGWSSYLGLVLCHFQGSGGSKLSLKLKEELCDEVEAVQFFSVEKIFLVIATLSVTRSEFMAQPACGGKDDIPWLKWLATCLREHALEPWAEASRILKAIGFHPNDQVDAGGQPAIAFRASFFRGDFKHPKANSQDMAGSLGASVLNVSHNAIVSLEHFEREVLGYLVRADPFAQVILGFSLQHQSPGRSYGVVYGRTSLKPTIAFCLARIAKIEPGQVVLDPCCGVGTIPILASKTCQPIATYLCGDLELASIFNGADKNLTAAAPYSVSLLAWNAKALPLRDQLVDVVLTDLPWGMREGSFTMCAKLYPKLMKQLIRVVKKGTGKAYLLTLDHKLLMATLNTPWCLRAWRTASVRDIRIGYHVKLFCLERTEA
ncbi:hypothetical protein L0F63_006013 [Massospora cicadina]|nr:hypothetical protein L0F63_006013 [Massospora cicadina]